jgi:hypothetical protein
MAPQTHHQDPPEVGDPQPRQRQPGTKAVRSEDPSLSGEANRLVTEELREVVGSNAVARPPKGQDSRRERHATHPEPVALLLENRLMLASTFLALVLVGVVASIAIGSWWALGAALAVHVVGTVIVVGLALRLTAETEHPSPTLAARLEAEGVGDPDVFFTDLVHEFEWPGRGHGAQRAGAQQAGARTARS